MHTARTTLSVVLVSMMCLAAGVMAGTGAEGVGARADLQTTTTCSNPHSKRSGSPIVVPMAHGTGAGKVSSGCLFGMDAVTASDAWAVGYYGTPYGDRPLIVHWDGMDWKPAHYPKPAYGRLFGVSGSSAGGVWAVGMAAPPHGPVQPLVEHWDGSTWKVVPAPGPEGSEADLIAVSSDSATDAWAVGSVYEFGYRPTINLEHWDGTSWSSVDFPDPHCQYPTINANAVQATSADDAWLVGDCPASDNALIAHWDGADWKLVGAPRLPVNDTGASLRSLDARGREDVWAVGEQYGTNQRGTYERPLTEHFDGTSWKVVPIPVIGGLNGRAMLRSVSIGWPKDVWAVGIQMAGSPLRDQPVAEHWDGTSWTRVDPPPPGGGVTDADLWSVAATPSHRAWTVGYAPLRATTHALVEEWQGSGWQIQAVKAPTVAYRRLESMDASASDDVWAVGWANYEHVRAYAEHWDGVGWRPTLLARAGYTSQLFAVAALDNMDAWAVGVQTDASQQEKALIEHWDGSTWRVVPSPLQAFSVLQTVSAVAPDDVWAFGSAGQGDVALHWDGKEWSEMPAPPSGDGQNPPRLTGSTALSSTDVWVVGSAVPQAGDTEVEYAAHWDGVGWTVAGSGPFSGEGVAGSVSAVDAHSPTDVTAVAIAVTRHARSRAAALHWDGASWSQRPIPGSGPDGVPSALSVASSDDVWVTGSGIDEKGSPFVDHWDGSSWAAVRRFGAGYSLLAVTGVSAISATDVWVAAERVTPNGSTLPVHLHWNGDHWAAL